MKTNVLQLKNLPPTQGRNTIFKYLSLLAMVLMLGLNGVMGQVTIASQDFESTPATPTWSYTNSGGSASSTNTGTPSSQRVRNGSQSYQFNNVAGVLTFGDITTTNYTSISIVVRISSISTNGSNGADGADFVRLFTKLNSASFASNTEANADIAVNGASNARWGYNASGTSTSSGTNVVVAGSAGTNQGTVYSTLTITIPNGTNTVGLRINTLNNDGTEVWCIDDVTITGTLSASAPILTTPTASSITTTTTTLGATITADGGAAISQRGTVWGTSAAPTGNVLAAAGTTVDPFTHGRTGFTANTLYTYRGYAINTNGTGYSPDGTFTTLSLAPTIGTGSGATQTSFTANWSAPASQGAATFTYTVEADDDINFASVNFTQSSISSATTTANVNTGLSAGTTYYYRVRAVNTGGNSAWSSTSAGVATLSASAPVITTPTSANIVNTTATLGGNVTSDGGAAITARGVVWSVDATNSNPTIGGLGTTNVTGSGTTGVFTVNTTSLPPNTLIAYRAYATNSVGTTYTTATTFTTLSVATKLGFGTTPPSTGNIGTNLTTFTVQAQRADNSLDPEYTGTVTLTSTGSISTGASAAFSGGEATFNATQFSGAGTFTITASSSPLTQITSSSIVISAAPVSIATWNFTTANTSNTPPTNLTVSAVSQGNNNGTTSLLDNGSASSGYTGSSAGNNAGAAARTGALNTGASGSAYFEFTLTPASGYIATVTGISFGARSTGTGPQAYSLRSSADSYASDIATGSISNNSAWALESNTGLSSSSADGTAITYRIYGHSGTGSPSANTANWRIDDLNITGLVTATTALTLSNDAFAQITTQNLVRNTSNNVISQSKLVVSGGTGVLTGLTFVTPITNSNYTLNDIGDFKLYYTTTNTFSTSNLLATYTSAKSGAGITETVPFPSFSQSLAAGTYYLWITADVKVGATSTNTIIVNAPTITASTGTVTNNGTATGIQTIVAGLATNVYFKANPSSSSVLDPSNWSLNSNGSTGNDFTGAIGDADINWNIRNSNATQAGTWTLGNNSKVIVGDGTNANSFTINSGALTGTVDVSNAATLTLNSTTIPTLGTLGATSSTVVYGASDAQAVTTKNYGNLTISGGNTKTISGAAAVSGTLTINGTVLALGSNSLTPNTLTLDGLGTKNGSWGSTDGSATYKNATYFGATGTGTVTPSSNTAATASITGVTSSPSITYGAATVTLSGTVASGSIFPANGETVSVTINGVEQTTTTTSGNGSFSINYTTSTLPVSAPYTITYAYAGTGNGFLIAANNNTATTLTVNAATNNWTGANGTWNTAGNWSLSRVPSSLNDDITISSGTPTMDAAYTVGSGRTLTISGTGTLIISPSGSITIAGTANFGGRPVTVQSDNTGTGSIGTITGTLNNASNVTVQRYVSGAGRRWRFLSSPVQSATVANWMTQFYVTGPGDGVTLGAALPITGWHTSQANITYPSSGNDYRRVQTTSIRTYNESASGNSTNLNAGWTNLSGTSQALTPGQGFRTFIRGAIGNTGQLDGSLTSQSAVTLALSGTVNQGDITPTLTNNTLGWNLLGNPYACAYNLKAQYDAAQTANLNNIDANYFVFDPITNGYKGYNPAASSGAGAGTLTSGIIPSGTAFFVQATGTPTFVFKEAFKTTSAPIALHKKASNSEFSIKYFKDSAESDEFIISIMEGATLNKDRFDINKLRNENLNLSSFGIDTLQLMLSSIPPVVSETRIKLNVEATAIGTYNFDFKNMDNFQSNITVSLFDRYTNKTTDVRKNTKYTFDMGAGVNQWGNNRFELILNLDKTNVDESALLNQTQMLVYPNPATDVLNINISNGSFKNSEVVVYNISGMEVLKTNMAANNAQLNIETLSNGVYFVKVSNQNGFNKTVKFVK